MSTPYFLRPMAASRDGTIACMESRVVKDQAEFFDVVNGVYLGRKDIRGEPCFGATARDYFTVDHGLGVRCWDLATGECVWTQPRGKHQLCWAAPSYYPQTEQLLVAAINDSTLVLDPASGEVLANLKGTGTIMPTDRGDLAFGVQGGPGEPCRFQLRKNHSWEVLDELFLDERISLSAMNVLGDVFAVIVKRIDKDWAASLLLLTVDASGSRLKTIAEIPKLVESKFLGVDQANGIFYCTVRDRERIGDQDATVNLLGVSAKTGRILSTQQKQGEPFVIFGIPVLDQGHQLTRYGDIIRLSDLTMRSHDLFQKIPDWPTGTK